MRKQEYYEYLLDIVSLDDCALLRTLYNIQYTVVITTGGLSNDYNRLQDGLELRNIYPGEEPDFGCTMLELIISICLKMIYLVNDPVNSKFGDMLGWTPKDINRCIIDEREINHRGFLLLINNLNLDLMDEDCDYIHGVCDRFMRREYNYYGVGGLFPITSSGCKDQREVEIWYQMASYLEENDVT